jgi:hypothetical protein
MPDVVKHLYTVEENLSLANKVDLVQPESWIPPHDVSEPPIKILVSEGIRDVVNINAHENSKVQLYINAKDLQEKWEGRITAMVSQMSGNAFWPNRVAQGTKGPKETSK